MSRLTSLLIFSLLLGLPLNSAALAQEPNAADEAAQPEAPQPNSPIAAYVTVEHPVNENMFSRIRNTMLDLQNQAEQQETEAFLILEVTRGTSLYGQVYELSKELRSAKYSKVRTIAWIPNDSDKPRLDGYAVVIALSCEEIVMHPDAEIGDIGRGEALDADEARTVTRLAKDGHNLKLDPALLAGFVDPAKAVLRIKTETQQNGQAVAGTEIVTLEELQRIQDTEVDIAILKVEEIINEGDIGIVSGRQARTMDILVTQTAEDRTELPDMYGFEPRYLKESVSTGDAPKVSLIRVDGPIDAVLEEFVMREIRRAESKEASIVIFQIDSPGGSFDISKRIAHRIADLDAKKHKTVAYIPKMAISGGAMIALGCDEIIMHPDASIGDVIPIQFQDTGWATEVPQKVLSIVRNEMALLAGKKNRPPALLEAMSDVELEVFKCTHKENGRIWYLSEAEYEAEKDQWIKQHPVPETRKEVALTVGGERANELGLASAPVSDFEELKTRLGIPKSEDIQAAKQSWVDTLVMILKTPGATFLLFIVGIFCIYLEVYTMTGFFGIGSAFCFAVFFWSRFLGGTAGWLEIVLFLFGLVLIALEIFVIPGFGVFGISGALAVVFALILASQTFVIPTTAQQMGQLKSTLTTLSGSIVACGFLAFLAGKYMPKLPGIRNLILAPPEVEEGPMLDPTLAGENSPTSLMEQDTALLNKTGVAFTTLRPAGRAQIDGQLVDVVSEGGFIDPGQPIEVIEVTGNRVVVRAATS